MQSKHLKSIEKQTGFSLFGGANASTSEISQVLSQSLMTGMNIYEYLKEIAWVRELFYMAVKTATIEDIDEAVEEIDHFQKCFEDKDWSRQWFTEVAKKTKATKMHHLTTVIADSQYLGDKQWAEELLQCSRDQRKYAFKLVKLASDSQDLTVIDTLLDTAFTLCQDRQKILSWINTLFADSRMKEVVIPKRG